MIFSLMEETIHCSFFGASWKIKVRSFSMPYLVRKPLHQDGNQQVEEDIVAEGHEGNKVEGCPVAGFPHPQEKNDVPVFLGQNLEWTRVRGCQ